jgi:hypothetical protein
MKAYVRHCITKLFFKSQGEWTALPDEALSFNTTKSAMEFCTTNRLSNVFLYLVLPNGEEVDVSLNANRP